MCKRTSWYVFFLRKFSTRNKFVPHSVIPRGNYKMTKLYHFLVLNMASSFVFIAVAVAIVCIIFHWIMYKMASRLSVKRNDGFCVRKHRVMMRKFDIGNNKKEMFIMCSEHNIRFEFFLFALFKCFIILLICNHTRWFKSVLTQRERRERARNRNLSQ